MCLLKVIGLLATQELNGQVHFYHNQNQLDWQSMWTHVWNWAPDIFAMVQRSWNK